MLVLRNAGARNITELGNWSIYFNWAHGGVDLLNPTALQSPTGARVRIVARHVDHWLVSWQLTSANSQQVRSIAFGYVFEPNETVEVKLPLKSRSYAFPQWYVAAPGLRSQVLRSTAGDDANFVRAVDRQPDSKRFDGNLVDDLGGAAASAGGVQVVLPTPLRVRMTQAAKKLSGVKIDESWKIVFTARPLEEMAKYLSGRCRTFVFDLLDKDCGTIVACCNRGMQPLQEFVMMQPLQLSLGVRSASRQIVCNLLKMFLYHVTLS